MDRHGRNLALWHGRDKPGWHQLEERRDQPWVLVATAHPAKFNDIVEPIIGKPVTVPHSLEHLLRLPRHAVDVPPTLEALAAAL